MRGCLSSVVAAIAVCAGSVAALAQNSPPGPKCWFWDAPPNPSIAIHPNFAPVVRILLFEQTTPEEAVNAAVAKYIAFASTQSPWVGPGKIAFFPQNTLSRHQPTTLYVASDTIETLNVPAGSWPGPFAYIEFTDAENRVFAARQPWLNGSAGPVRGWYLDFATLWKEKMDANLLPAIDRAHFDVEPHPPTDMFDPRMAYVLYEMRLDSRWTTTSVYGFGETMATLWNQVKNNPGFFNVGGVGARKYPLMESNYAPNGTSWPRFDNSDRLVGMW